MRATWSARVGLAPAALCPMSAHHVTGQEFRSLASMLRWPRGSCAHNAALSCRPRPADGAWVRFSAVCGLLRLARAFDAAMPAPLYANLALTFQEPLVEPRRDMTLKLHSMVALLAGKREVGCSCLRPRFIEGEGRWRPCLDGVHGRGGRRAQECSNCCCPAARVSKDSPITRTPLPSPRLACTQPALAQRAAKYAAILALFAVDPEEHNQGLALRTLRDYVLQRRWGRQCGRACWRTAQRHSSQHAPRWLHASRC